MVKSDILYQFDLRMQEITEKIGVLFGGIAMFAFGDMMQLKPVMGQLRSAMPHGDLQLPH